MFQSTGALNLMSWERWCKRYKGIKENKDQNDVTLVCVLNSVLYLLSTLNDFHAFFVFLLLSLKVLLLISFQNFMETFFFHY